MQMRTLFGVGSLCLSAIAGSAGATIIASDSYTIGSSPAAGQYVAATALVNQPTTLVTTGFVTGAYTAGTGTSNFQANNVPVGSAATINGSGGQVNWLGLASTATATNRSTARNVTGAPSPAVYYTSQLLQLDPTTTPGSVGSFVGEGFGNSVAPVTTAAGGNLQGFYVGFGITGASDTGSLTIRSRTTTGNTVEESILVNGTTNTVQGNTFRVITKSTYNYLGGSADLLQYWVNPADTSSDAAMTASTPVGFSGSIVNFGLQGASDLTRLNFAAVGSTSSAGVFTDSAAFDEIKAGNTLADVAAVPEPTTLAAVAGAGLAMLRRRRRRA